MAKNIASFLIPKSHVVWVPTEVSMRHVLEAMERSAYTAIPLLDRHGRYYGTITEGDLMRLMVARHDLGLKDFEDIRALDVPLRTHVRPVGVDTQLEQVLSRIIEQNFVPVEDSRGAFIGIVRRREILEHCAELLRSKRERSAV